MLTSDKLILVELHKAGAARLQKLLGDLLGGEKSGKRSSYADELASLGKPVVGYVCNPLTWYLEQWQLGCAGKGDIHKRLTSDVRWGQLNARLKNRDAKQGDKPDRKQIPQGWGPEHARSFWYADAENPEAFREWLRAVVGERGLRKLVDHGYGASPMSRVAGLMSYQFFNTFVRGAENMEKSVNSREALAALHADQKITSHFIRAESVGTDLRQVLNDLGVMLSGEQDTAVGALKERAGATDAAIARFYDTDSLRLVAKREVFLNELFGYGPPGAVADAAARSGKQNAGRLASEAKVKERDKDHAEGPKLSKAEKEQKRLARSERQAAKAEARSEKKARATQAAPANSNGSADAMATGNTKPAKPRVAKRAKPVGPRKKAKAVKKQRAGDDSAESDE